MVFILSKIFVGGPEKICFAVVWGGVLLVEENTFP